LKALDWVRAGWGFASRFENVKPFYLLYAAFFLVAGALAFLVLGALGSGLNALFEGPLALEAAVKNALWLVPVALFVLLSFFVAHLWVEIASYYRFGRVKNAFRSALSAVPGAILAILFLSLARGAIGSLDALGGVVGTTLSLFLILAFLFVVPAYAFHRNLLKAFAQSWQLFSGEALEVLVFAVVSWVVGAVVVVAGLIAAGLIVALSLAWPALLIVLLPLALAVFSYFLGFANAFGAGALAAAYLTLSRRPKSFRVRRRA